MSRLLQNVWGPVVIVAAWVLVAGGFGAALAADAPAGFEDLKAAIKEARPPEAAPATTPATPAGLPAVGQSVEIGQSGSSRGIELAVERLSVRNEYGTLAAPQGSVLLVLDTKWTNIIPLTYIYERMVPTQYQVPNLADHLYLVVNGSIAARLAPGAQDLPGHVTVKDFKIERLGAEVRGNCAFIVPTDKIQTVELRFYDFAHGSITLPLVGTSEAFAAEKQVKPLAKTEKNEVIEAGIFALNKTDQLAGKAAPAGMTYVSIDFRARSMFKTEADASAFDPKAKAGAKTTVGTVADWTDSRKYLQLVADGEYGYAPDEASGLDPAPRFLPDVMTGGRVVFLAPKDAKSLELRCDFPNAKTPDGKVLRPKGMTMALEGKRPALANKKPVSKIEDDVFVVNVTGETAAETFAGATAAQGKRFIVLDMTVQNRGKDGEQFQTEPQLKLANAAGQQLALDPATWAGVYHPAPLVWIPPGERRSFEVAYQLDVTETRPRLAYTGVSKAEVVDLGALAPPAAAASAAPVASGTPAPATPSAPAAPGASAQMPAKPAEGNTQVATHTPAPAVPVAPGKPAPAVKPAPAMIEVEGKKFPARVPIHPRLEAKGLPGVGLTAEQVNEAIDKGSAFLWKYIEAENAKSKQALGTEKEHVLAALALVHSGAHKKFPEFDAQLRKFMAGFKPNENRSTYQIGLYCMLVEAYGDPTYIPQLKACARWLVETQGQQGAWGYGMSVDPKVFEDNSDSGQVLKVAGGRPLDGSDVSEPVARTSAKDKGFDGDNSVSQYALLGLHAASRSRVKPAPAVWTAALATHEKRQNKTDGGWSYEEPSYSYGSMTCAGLCALALTRHELDQASDPAIEERIERGLAWLSANFSVDKHPGTNDTWLYYYLYSVERVGRILDTEFIGDHEWYPAGAKFLVGKQAGDGSWRNKGGEEEDPRVAGSFALLFLTRATASLAEQQRSGPGILKTAVLLPPGRQVYIILDASGSMLEEMNGKPKFEIAREALTALVNELPPNAQVALRAYGYRKRAIEEGASEDTKLLVPMGPLDKKKMLEILQGIRARGKTPMALSLEEAKGEIPAATPDMPVTVLLLTDGGEDTQPRKDPVAAAAALAKIPNVRVRIVGFDINREDWSQQLQAMAAASGGQYLPARQGDVLLRELRTAVFETPDAFTLFDSTNKPIFTGEFGQSMQLPAGKYRIRATYAGRTFEENAWVNAGTTTAVTFQAAQASGPSAQEVKGEATAPAGAPAAAVPPAPGQAAAPAPGQAPAAAATPAPEQAPAPGAAQPAGKKFCTQCGAALKPGAKFCTSCGAKTGQ